MRTSPAEPARPPSLSKGGAVALLLLLGGLASLRSLRSISEALLTLWTFTYEHGFLKRALVGDIVARTFGPPSALFVTIVGGGIALVLAVVLLRWFAGPALREERPGAWLFALVAATHSATLPNLFYDLGRFDHIGFLLLLGCLAVIGRGTPRGRSGRPGRRAGDRERPSWCPGRCRARPAHARDAGVGTKTPRARRFRPGSDAGCRSASVPSEVTRRCVFRSVHAPECSIRSTRRSAWKRGSGKRGARSGSCPSHSNLPIRFRSIAPSRSVTARSSSPRAAAMRASQITCQKWFSGAVGLSAMRSEMRRASSGLPWAATRCGHPNCHCAEGEGHPVWRLRFLRDGKPHLENIPAEWVEEVQRRVDAGRAAQDATLEVLTANAELLALEKAQRARRKTSRKRT